MKKYSINIDDKIIINFFKKINLHNWIEKSYSYKKDLTSPFSHGNNIIKPDLKDLYFLYHLILNTKRTTILEFGCGYSTYIMSLALNVNKKKYENQVKNLRRNDAFKVFSVDDSKKFIQICKKRIKKIDKNLKNFNLKYAKTNFINFHGNLAIKYKELPKTSPDMVYIDGPSQLTVSNSKIAGFDINHPDLVPITCDMLLIEYFLIPGTIICVDGRGANAQFLKDNFKRNWIYKYLKNIDFHIFILNAPALGVLNTKQLKFFKNSFFE